MTSIVRADNISTVAGTGTVTLEAGNTLDTSAGLVTPAGHVIQVIQDIATEQVTISAAAGADVGLSVTITPSSASSKFFITTDIQARINYSVGMGIEIKKSTDGGSTFSNVLQSKQDYDLYCDVSSSNLRMRGSWSYLDSPATTNQLIYKIRARSYAPGNTLYVNNAGQSMLTVMEIAG
jgi:hypothetical protein